MPSHSLMNRRTLLKGVGVTLAKAASGKHGLGRLGPIY